jgi:hypothetical protein
MVILNFEVVFKFKISEKGSPVLFLQLAPELRQICRSAQNALSVRIFKRSAHVMQLLPGSIALSGRLLLGMSTVLLCRVFWVAMLYRISFTCKKALTAREQELKKYSKCSIRCLLPVSKLPDPMCRKNPPNPY